MQVALTSIAAPTGNESARAAEVQRLLRDLQLETRGDSAGNVTATVAPARTTAGDGVVCLAHLDTVYSDAIGGPCTVTVHREGAQVRAPGIGDNGRGLAALLTLGAALQTPSVRERLTRPVHLVATVGEEGEGNLRGARAWFETAERDGLDIGAAIAVDGPGDSTIVHDAVGAIRLRVRLHGAGGHSWVHAGGENPVHAMGQFIARAVRLGDAWRRDAVVTITRMGGGESLTSIPASAWADVDLRGTSMAQLQAVHRELQCLAHEVSGETLRVEIDSLGERPTGRIGAGHPLVRAAVHATEAVGLAPRSASASSDANIPLSRGIPAIAIGAGGTGGGAHTADEWYDDTDGWRGMERVLRLVLGLATGPQLP